MNKKELNEKTHNVINKAITDAKFNNSHLSPASIVLRALKDNNLGVFCIDVDSTKVTIYELIRDGEKIGLIFGEKNKELSERITTFLNKK